MVRSFLSRVLPSVGLAIVSMLGASCAEEREPINRVQADVLSKAFFVGDLDDPDDDPEFYMRNTVVDVAAGAGADGLFTSSDAQPVARVRFEITESMLIARLTYELVENTDGKGVRRTADGQIVAAFAIQSHFDIRRDYNPTTGEETNVVVENTTDRVWNDREYFRVDWSRNLVTDAYDLDTLSQLGIYYGVAWDPVAYYVNDPAHPDAPVFDTENGYFDVTHKALASPETLEDEWGTYPACWLIGSWPTLNCNPSEITLRQSFRRVEDHDYEPLAIDGTMMDMFGYFTWDRFGYDRRYGVVDDEWHRFATRWNLWERSHAEPAVECNSDETTPTGADPHRDEDADGTEDECASVGRGSKCDAVVGECTIPLRDRTIKAIPWHVNREFPADLYEGTAEALEAWNHAMRVAILAGRLAECRRSGETNCEAEMGWPEHWSDDYDPPKGTESLAEVPDVFVLCHNPVAEDDHEACGAPGTSPRLGDLRYNMMTIIDDVELMSPWGIMMDAEDVLTGEKISGSVNQWAYVLDRAASNLVDILALLNGEMSPEDFIGGENVSSWIEANRPGGSAERYLAMDSQELASRFGAYDPSVMEPYFANMAKPKAHMPPAGRHAQRLEGLVEQGRLGPGNAELAARVAALRDTPIEAALATPEMVQAVGYDPTAVPTDDAIRRSSPFRKMNPAFRRAERRSRALATAARHSCRYDATSPDYLLGLAKVAQKLFPPPADPTDLDAVNEHRKQVYDWARRETSKGVMAHEIGHSMGLRHNFAASFDSLNYDKRYWQLRTNNGTATEDCVDGETDGASCIGPRYRDPMSDAEVENNLSRYATTSVMDYPGDQNQDMLVAGTYDRAALRFGYAGLVDVWNGEGVSTTGSGAGKAKAYELAAFTVSPGLFGVMYFPPVSVEQPYIYHHYSTYQREFDVLGECTDTDDPDAVLGKSCAGAPMDVVDYRDMSDFASDPDYAKFSWGVNSKAVDPAGRVRRGYMFSSDEYADSGNVPSFSNDAGADAYEQIAFLEAAYENRYIFDSFRRNRVQFNSGDVTWRVQARYLDNLQMIAKAFFFGAVLDGDPTAPTEEFLADGAYGPLAVGSSMALDLFARILTRPDPGYYCWAPYCGGVQPWGVEEDVYVADWAPLPEVYLYDFSVGLGDGRYLHNDYDYSQGYFWGDYQTQVGAYYDKVWAVYYLGEAFDFFISNSKEDFVDSRYKNVNFATVYPNQIRRLFANVLTGDYRTYAPWATPPSNPDDTPAITLEYPQWHAEHLGSRPAGSLLVDPNYGWNTQINAMVWGTMFFPTNWSTQWVHDARIAFSQDDPEWPETETYRFFDPKSGLLYRAHMIGTEDVSGRNVQKGTAARVLEWANHLVTVAYIVERDDNGDPIWKADGQPLLTLDANGAPQLDPANAGAEIELAKYVDTIDLYRQLIKTFEHPISDLPEP
ncbi:MAG: hypothetical protein HOW73_15035 [Polyangiaceae bacterium]|nr:hypothetical protein [Polyangiaceae bacterium]